MMTKSQSRGLQDFDFLNQCLKGTSFFFVDFKDMMLSVLFKRIITCVKIWRAT